MAEKKFFGVKAYIDGALGERQIRVRASTGTTDRMGDILIPKGCVVPGPTVPVFVDHAATIDGLVGRAVVTVQNDSVDAVITFLAAGMSAKADDVCAKYKSGFATDVSVGFDPLDFDLIKGGGVLYKQWEMLELSCVGIGCNREANVTGKTLNEGKKEWKCSVSRTLPMIDGAFEATAAAESIFAWAGGADFDPSRARKGFLVYDAANPKSRESYKFPIAKAVGGRLFAIKSAVKNARVDDGFSDITADALGEYAERIEKGAGMASGKTKVARKGLYEVGWLASLLGDLSWLEDSVEWEAEVEGDGSPVPQMLTDALSSIGAILIAMTQEEVAELVGAETAEDAEKSLRKRIIKTVSAKIDKRRASAKVYINQYRRKARVARLKAALPAA